MKRSGRTSIHAHGTAVPLTASKTGGRRVRKPKSHYGIRPFPKRGGVVTNELVDKLRAGDLD